MPRVELQVCPDVEDFAAAAAPLLEADEAGHCLLYATLASTAAASSARTAAHPWRWPPTGGMTPTGVRIGPVYTPVAFRRHGYGTALTAALTRDLLARGRRSVFLFTDAANPTSNSIDGAIGYRRVAEHVHMRVDA
ncbi:MAG TPA: GNAT family N-acetyltransferase [Candidatus Dormibacteraeota bacterium]|jgi:hypothetical protein|nr:GNAT family N-acetyltransferase [Candidatus Dormibacteraeota bacterium]